MEDTLRGNMLFSCATSLISLNPCFNGRYSQSQGRNWEGQDNIVLILVLMEDTLRDTQGHRSV